MLWIMHNDIKTSLAASVQCTNNYHLLYITLNVDGEKSRTISNFQNFMAAKVSGPIVYRRRYNWPNSCQITDVL